MRAADGSDWAEIRVFDFCRDQAYLPFEETVVLAKKYGLPLVARVEATLDLPVILGALRKQGCYTGIPGVELEGFVIRGRGDGDAIAKIRKEDLPKIDPHQS